MEWNKNKDRNLLSNTHYLKSGKYDYVLYSNKTKKVRIKLLIESIELN